MFASSQGMLKVDMAPVSYTLQGETLEREECLLRIEGKFGQTMLSQSSKRRPLTGQEMVVGRE